MARLGVIAMTVLLPLMVLGRLLAAGGLFLLSFLDVDTGFWELPFPGQLLLGLGLGFTSVPLSNLALIGAGAHDAGAASAMLNATQQVGASIGTALLATLSVGAITDFVTDAVASGGDPQDPAVALAAQVEGCTTAFTWAAGLLLVGGGVGGADQGDQGRPARGRRRRRPRHVNGQEPRWAMARRRAL